MTYKEIEKFTDNKTYIICFMENRGSRCVTGRIERRKILDIDKDLVNGFYISYNLYGTPYGTKVLTKNIIGIFNYGV